MSSLSFRFFSSRAAGNVGLSVPLLNFTLSFHALERWHFYFAFITWAGHATTLLRQRDQDFLGQTIFDYYNYVYIRCGYSINTPRP